MSRYHHQAELDRQVARHLGESVQEIAHRGFSLCSFVDEDARPLPVEPRRRRRTPAVCIEWPSVNRR
jgi:hypothetical protein